MRKKILSILMMMSLIVGMTYNVAFATESYQSMIEDAKKKSEDAQKQLDEVNVEIDSAMQEVEKLSTSISEVEEELQEISQEITSLNESISEKQKDLDEKQLLLDERLSAAYMKENNTYLEAFFTGGLLNFISNYDMIKQIAEYDTNLIQEVKDVKNSLENEKIKLENIQVEKQAKSKELNDLKAEKEEKINTLTEEQKQIQSQIEEYDSQMKILEAKEKALAAKAAQYSTGTGIAASSGALGWPVPSSRSITSVYGYRVHPISGTLRLHAGIDIGAAGGTDIVAAEAGTVYLASMGYNGGYGNYIIIDHGNGLTTRYAHCSALYVSVGQTVAKGQTIAAVGSTGASTGDHCHFEVRINGESKNPVSYL